MQQTITQQSVPLSLESVTKTFRDPKTKSDVHAVRDVSLDVRPGEVLAIVGESGSGKTVTARSILGLLPETATARGAVILAGTEVVGLSGEKLREVRGTRSIYHNNAIQSWLVQENGEVKNVQIA